MAFEEVIGQQPSRNPANDDSLAGVFREVLRKTLQRTDDMLPARVEVYDRETNRAKVLPLAKLVTTDGTTLSRASLPSVPVLQLGGGGFFVSFPIAEGDLGWIKASDRDISLILQSYDEERPNTNRLHSFEDAVFIPDTMTGYTIESEDQSRMVIQDLNGGVKISIGDTIKIQNASTTIEVDSAETTLTGDVKINGAVDVVGNFTVDGTIEATGTISTDQNLEGTDVTATGAVNADGQVTAFASIPAASVGLATHIHTSGGPGSPSSPPTGGT